MITPFPPPTVPPPTLGPGPAERRRRRVGLWVQLLWSPALAAAVILTLSLYGLVMGLPLLVLSLPPFLAGRRRRNGRVAPRTFVVIGVLGIAAVVAYDAWYLLANGDLDPSNDAFDSGDAWAWSVLTTWSLTTLWMTARLWPTRNERLLAAQAPRLPQAERKRRRVGLWGQLLWSPVLVVGVFLTVYAFELVAGLSLLIPSLLAFLVSGRRRKGRDGPRLFVAAGVLGIVVVVAYAAWYLVTGPPGVNDGGVRVDVIGWAVLPLWSLTTLWMTARLWPTRSVIQISPDRAISE